VAWPILKRYHFPVTLCLTTYYCFYNRPIFDLICPYLLWQARDGVYDLIPQEFCFFTPSNGDERAGLPDSAALGCRKNALDPVPKGDQQ
jgi:hypothetical protein